MIRFTIGTVSSNLEFEEEMRLLKSSLLYADEIQLIGMVEYMVFSYLPSHIYNAKDWDQLLRFIAPFFKSMDIPGGKELLDQIENASFQIHQFDPILKKKKHRTKDEILAQLQFQKIFKDTQEQIKTEVEKLISTPAANDIQSLINQKIITVFNYGYEDFEINELVGSYFGNLMNAMHNNISYPLFDKTSESVIRQVNETQILDIGRMNREVLRHAGIASNILMTLPTLEEASIDEILDFKQENKKYLENFRKAIYGFSEKINSLPWDHDFQYDCLKLYYTEVLPSVETINTIVDDTSVLKNFGGKVLADEEIRRRAGWAVSGVAATIITCGGLVDAFNVLKQALLSLSLISISPQIAKGFLKSANFLYQSKQETKEEKRKADGNTMYYYYKAKTDL